MKNDIILQIIGRYQVTYGNAARTLSNAIAKGLYKDEGYKCPSVDTLQSLIDSYYKELNGIPIPGHKDSETKSVVVLHACNTAAYEVRIYFQVNESTKENDIHRLSNFFANPKSKKFNLTVASNDPDAFDLNLPCKTEFPEDLFDVK